MRKKRNVLIEQGEVNVVPLMDILTTMLFFLILMASSVNFSAISSKSDLVGAESTQKKEQQFDLVIALKTDRQAKIYLGKFNKLKLIDKDDFTKYMNRNFRYKSSLGYNKTLYGKSHEDLMEKIQKELIRIKQAFPHEEKVSLAVANKVEYQKMISTMDQLTLVTQDKAFNLENFIGQVRMARILFPKISLQELGDQNAI